MKALKLFTLLLFFATICSAQTLKIETAEKLFKQNSTQFLDTLKERGFTNLSDSEIIDDKFVSTSNKGEVITKQMLYNSKGLRKVFELRKRIYGGQCKITINMIEPGCKMIESITWNANLRLDASSYVRELERLGYKRTEEAKIEKYINSDGYTITIKILDRANEIRFLMSKIK
jgi:hypothetical protein